MRSLLAAAPGLLSLLMTALPAAAQQSDSIWACEDDQGHKVFQNVGNGRGCRRVDGLIATVPGTTPAPQPRASSGQPVTGVSPANFPRVDRDVQRLRDVDRRRILEDELRVEQDRLVRLRQDFNNGTPRLQPDENAASASYRVRAQRLMEDIQRSEGSIASLKRELTPARY
ncbi:MAG TPA: DUF4124 domain-containing protein [Burkholderiaceae bacterium]|jgi:hypothetical protein